LFYQLIIHACFEADLRKNNFCKFFPQFLSFQCEAFGRPLLASGRVWLSRPDGSVTCPNMHDSDGRTVRLHVWTRGTCLHVYKATRIQTGLMICPNGDPTTSIKHGHFIFSLPHKISPLASSERFLASFCIISLSFIFLCKSLTFQVFF
jgi:hypothetical protein